MCEICRQTPCHPRCPNAPEPKPVFYCESCGEAIREGDIYFDIEGEPYCEDCVSLHFAVEGLECVSCGENMDEDFEYYLVDNKTYCPACVVERYAQIEY